MERTNPEENPSSATQAARKRENALVMGRVQTVGSASRAKNAPDKDNKGAGDKQARRGKRGRSKR